VTEDVKLRKKEKCYYDVEISQNKNIINYYDEMPQNKHIINYCDSRLTRKVNNQYISYLVYTQNDNLEPEEIPIVINGCGSETRDLSVASKNEEAFHTQNTLNDLYVKLLDDRTSIPNFSKHKVLLIGDSHERGYSENMKLILSDQFQVSGFIKPGAETKAILEQTTNDIDNLLSCDFIILSYGSNDNGRVKLNEVNKKI
jgi:hypothetical protein